MTACRSSVHANKQNIPQYVASLDVRMYAKTCKDQQQQGTLWTGRQFALN